MMMMMEEEEEKMMMGEKKKKKKNKSIMLCLPDINIQTDRPHYKLPTTELPATALNSPT
jgi:hypothetical protein